MKKKGKELRKKIEKKRKIKKGIILNQNQVKEHYNQNFNLSSYSIGKLFSLSNINSQERGFILESSVASSTVGYPIEISIIMSVPLVMIFIGLTLFMG
jgi:hypothetical protein